MLPDVNRRAVHPRGPAPSARRRAQATPDAVSGRVPDEINDSLAYDIGRAYAAFVKPRRVAVGYDTRLSSPQLAKALKRGLMDVGVDVLDIGLWGTEGSYFATVAEKLDGGIMVTASHNPPDYNA